jgi:hypothetical protein
MRMADRVKESTTSTGTGNVSLGGAATGYRAFSSVYADGDTLIPYCIAGGGEWEVGFGTYNSSGNTLSRVTVLSSSNSGSLVNFSSGSKEVFVTAPGARLGIQLLTPQSATGTAIDFTIPAGARAIHLGLDGLQTNGSSAVMFQLGDAGGIENTSYKSVGCIEGGSGGSTVASSTAGFLLGSAAAASSMDLSGEASFRLIHGTSRTWVYRAGCSRITGTVQEFTGSGRKSLSDEITTVRVTTVSGDTFNAGTISGQVEF